MTKKLTSTDNTVGVTHRQELVSGFNQASLEAATIILVGAGGIGSEIGEGLVRKGVGYLKLFDHDTIEITNLNRQMFFENDVHHRKGKRLAKNLAAHAIGRTVLEGYDLSFQDALALGIDMSASVAVCGVDNGATRVAVSNYFRQRNIPVVFIAVDYAAEHGYVFVQEPGEACFGCLFPKTMYGRKAPCFTPAVKDVLKVVAGLSLYAIDTLLMPRKRNWNFRNVHLAGFGPSEERFITRNSNCPLCHE
ncbi:MAG: ThiF family adenylyltransferase [Limisphaerales bacterium]